MSSREPKFPWEISHALRPERLRLLNDVIRRVRNAVVDATNLPEKGDDSWVIGCRGHRWLHKALQTESEAYPYLTVDTDGLYFCARLDGEPIRIYRGDVDGRPSARHIQACLRELEKTAAQTILPGAGFSCPDDEWFWMIAVEYADDHRVLRVGILQANEHGDVRYPPFILDDTLMGLASVAPQREGRDLPDFDFQMRDGESAAGNDDDKGNDGAE